MSIVEGAIGVGSVAVYCGGYDSPLEVRGGFLSGESKFILFSTFHRLF